MVTTSVTADPVKDGKYLENVQGDIWSRGFPKHFETYYFFTIKEGQAKTFSQNLHTLADATTPLLPSGTTPLISSLQKVKNDWVKIDELKEKVNAEKKNGHPLPEKDTIYPVANALIAFTFKGLKVIQRGFGDNAKTLELKIAGSCYPAFSDGMAAAKALNDPPRDQGGDVCKEKKDQEEVHGLLKIAGSSEEKVRERLEAIQKLLGYDNGVISDVTDGKSEPAKEASRVDGRTRPGDDRGKEHFGFEDGISQPLMVGIDKIPETSFTMKTDPNTLIVAKGSQIEGNPSEKKRPDWMQGGSFLVFRKLEQNVASFNTTIKEFSGTCGLSEEHMKAKLMGRWPSGAPIAMEEFHTQGSTDTERVKLLNDFKYDNDICPLSAHIRKTNPRGNLDSGNAFRRCPRTKMIRNGIPYGKVGDAKVGLLFACYQAHIEDSFQEMQANWSNKQGFPFGGSGMDPIIGQAPLKNGINGKVETITNTTTDKKESTQELQNSKNLNFTQFVTMKGGEYFFVPSIPALREGLGQTIP